MLFYLEKWLMKSFCSAVPIRYRYAGVGLLHDAVYVQYMAYILCIGVYVKHILYSVSCACSDMRQKSELPSNALFK